MTELSATCKHCQHEHWQVFITSSGLLRLRCARCGHKPSERFQKQPYAERKA